MPKIVIKPEASNENSTASDQPLVRQYYKEWKPDPSRPPLDPDGKLIIDERTLSSYELVEDPDE